MNSSATSRLVPSEGGADGQEKGRAGTRAETISHQPRIFLANVGVNAGHSLRSPLFDDGRFEFLPIPEDYPLAGPRILRYRDLRSFYDPAQSLEPYVPGSYLARPVHADPEFETFTYGDDCATSPRAAALRQLRPDDYLVFLARLASWRLGDFTDERGFYFVGFLEIAEVVAGVRSTLSAEQLARYGQNAHVRRALAEPARYDDFWVFRGGPGSRRLHRAVALNRDLAAKLFRDRSGQPWQWQSRRSELQTIGSYTRTCRCVIDMAEPDGAERAALLWQALGKGTGRTSSR